MDDAVMDDIRQDLAQFEPDPDGVGVRDPGAEAADLAAHAVPDDSQWVAWTDEVDESDWAEFELRSYGGR